MSDKFFLNDFYAVIRRISAFSASDLQRIDTDRIGVSLLSVRLQIDR